MSDAENDGLVANRIECGSQSSQDGPSPDKPALKKRNKQLESELDVRARELHASKSAIMQLLEQVQGAKDSGDESSLPLQRLPALLRRSTDSASSILAATKQTRHVHSAAAHDYLQQITSRDKIIAELRARNQGLREEMREAVGECRRLGEQTKADRRLREQHGKMLASVKGLKQQVEAEIAGRARLEADLASLQAKVKHEASKNAMHRENERVLDSALASKQELLDNAHATLSQLHERFSAVTQVVASATHTAQGLDDTAHTKATASRGAAAALEEAGDETQRLAVRCSALLAALAHERDSKKAAEKRAAGLEGQLAALQTAQGVAALAGRASEADLWQHRASVAAQQLDRLKAAYQRVLQQHAELRRQLEVGALASPGSAANSPAAAGQIVVHTPSPVAFRGSGGALPSPAPTPPAFGLPLVPADKRRRAEVLAAEVANIRSRIAVLRSSYGDDPAAANLII